MTCHTRGLLKHVRYEVQLSHFICGRLQCKSQLVHWGGQGASRGVLYVTFNIGKPALDRYVPSTSNFFFSHCSTNSPFPSDTGPKVCDNPASLTLWVRLAGLWNLLKFVCVSWRWSIQEAENQGSRKRERERDHCITYDVLKSFADFWTNTFNRVQVSSHVEMSDHFSCTRQNV